MAISEKKIRNKLCLTRMKTVNSANCNSSPEILVKAVRAAGAQEHIS